MPKPLTISPAPFKSSHLSTPPSPFSPRLPLTPPASPPNARSSSISSSKRELSSPSTPPPSPALKWVWQCHICHRTYPLGATRRCLDDGHYFCSGVTTVKTWRASTNPRKRTKKHRACPSEFDYAGWKKFAHWRRSEEAIRNVSFDTVSDSDDTTGGDCSNFPSLTLVRTPQKRTHRDCWNRCDFPSECRWGSQYGMQACATPLLPAAAEEHPSYSENSGPEPQSSPSSAAPKLDTAPATLFCSAYTPPTTFDGILDRHQEGDLSPLSPKELRDKFWDGILDSARQRKKSKGNGAHSPLALHPVTEEPEPESPGLTSPEPAFEDGGRAGSRTGPAGVSERLFEALDRWTLPGLGEEEVDVQTPEPVIVASSSSGRGQGFDFGFAEEEEEWNAGVQIPKVGVRVDKAKKGKCRKLRRRV